MQTMKEKVAKLGYFKTWKFCSEKDTKKTCRRLGENIYRTRPVKNMYLTNIKTKKPFKSSQ